MKWPIKAVNISGSEIKQSFAAKNPPLTTEEPTSHQKLPALYSTAISNTFEPFLGSNIQQNAVHPPKILSCLLSPHPAKLLHLQWKSPALSEPGSDLAPLCLWIDILKEFILNTHRGSFFPHPAEIGEFPLGLGALTPPRHTLHCRYSLGQQGKQRSCKAPAGGMEHMPPTTWNTLGQALSRRTPTDSQKPQTWSSRLARRSKYVILWGGRTSHFALSPFSLCLFQLISETNTAEKVPVVF